jgi:type III pantothenate kinase
MILTLDVGNSQIFGGVFNDKGEIRNSFRKSSQGNVSADELGLFFRSVLRENNIDPKDIQDVAICSVVPDLMHSLRGACQKYFFTNPFVLQAGVKTGLKIRYRNPLEVGADRIANAIGAMDLFVGKNLIVVDFGTATTFCVITFDREYLGGLILPGPRLMMEALEAGTAKLPKVEILVPQELVGQSTIESIQSGIYYSNVAAISSLSSQIKKDYLSNGKDTLVIGTGGFSRLFEKENVFDVLVPELVLKGLFKAYKMNTQSPELLKTSPKASLGAQEIPL